MTDNLPPLGSDATVLTASETVSETGGHSDQGKQPGSDTPDSSDTVAVSEDEDLLTGLRTGSWLDSQDFPPLRYAVPGLIPEGLSLLVGPPKAGKSWLLLDMLLAVAAGGYTLGTIKAGSRRPVLYLALEDGDRRMQDRCRTLLDRAPIPEEFHYLTHVQPGLVLATINQFMLRTPGAALVVVDTLGKVTPPALSGESAYGRDYRVAGALKRVADTHPGLAVLVAHHDRKAAAEDFVDAVSGTNGLAGAADTIVVLARKRQAAEALLSVTGRDVHEESYALALSGGRWTLEGSTLAEAAEAARNREESAGRSDRTVEILTFVRSHPAGVQAGKIAEKFGSDAYQYLKRLVEDGMLTKPRRGLYIDPTKTRSEVSELSDSQVRGGSGGQGSVSELSERRAKRSTHTPASDTSDSSHTPPDVGSCAVCGHPMKIFEDGQTTHPGCDPEGVRP